MFDRDNGTKTVLLNASRDGRIEGVVQARGFELMVRGRGVRAGSLEPVAVVLHRHGGTERIEISRQPGGPGRFAALAAVPVVAFAVRRMLRPAKVRSK